MSKRYETKNGQFIDYVRGYSFLQEVIQHQIECDKWESKMTEEFYNYFQPLAFPNLLKDKSNLPKLNTTYINPKISI